MADWVRYWAQLIGIAAACLTLALGTALGISPGVVILRSLAVGALVSLVARIAGDLVGKVVLRMVAEDQLRRDEERRAENDEDEEDESDAIDRIKESLSDYQDSQESEKSSA